jgi:hypothetical protein
VDGCYAGRVAAKRKAKGRASTAMLVKPAEVRGGDRAGRQWGEGAADVADVVQPAVWDLEGEEDRARAEDAKDFAER